MCISSHVLTFVTQGYFANRKPISTHGKGKTHIKVILRSPSPETDVVTMDYFEDLLTPVAAGTPLEVVKR